MIGIGFGIVGIVLFGTFVVAAIIGLGGLARVAHAKSQVELEKNKGAAEELRHARKVLEIQNQMRLNTLLDKPALPPGEPEARPEGVKVKEEDILDPLRDAKERREHERMDRFAEPADFDVFKQPG